MTDTQQLIERLETSADGYWGGLAHDAATKLTRLTTALTEAEAKLKTVLDREAETIRRYDIKLDTVEAKLAKANTQVCCCCNEVFSGEGQGAFICNPCAGAD